MSRITISDLAIDSNSFLNEVAENEAAFVNGGGGFSKKDAAGLLTAILTAYFTIGQSLIEQSGQVVNFLIKFLEE